MLALTGACSETATTNVDAGLFEDSSVAVDMTAALDANVTADANVTTDAEVAIDMTALVDAEIDAGIDATVDASLPIDADAPDAAPTVTTLAASVSNLALAVSGNARVITLTNTGAADALHVMPSISPAFPIGTTQASTCGAALAPGNSCSITITPGATPSADPGLASVPSSLTLAGSNTNTLAVDVHVLDYGNIYQGGFIFAIDDTTPTSGSIGGKVAATRDQTLPYPSGVLFSATADGGGTTVASDNIPGIHELTSAIAGDCNGATDGACNSNVIREFYSPPTTDPSVPFYYFAAGVCASVIDGYSDWYLPAICELGYDETGSGNGCGTAAAPLVQNMQSNLVDRGNLGGLVSDDGGLSNFMWSSTLFSALPSQNAWAQNFAAGGGSAQTSVGKSNRLAIRCVRALTY